MTPLKDMLQTFGDRVRELRKEAGWSQEEFADEADLDRTYIGGIERGDKIAETFGVTISELMDGVG